MSFLPENASENQSLAHDFTKQLHAAVGTERKIQVSFDAWIKEFGFLIKHVGKEKLKTVLDWYCTNFGKDFVPVATTAKLFRLKFKQIEAAMGRDSSLIKHRDSDFATALTQQYTWPTEVVTALPGIVALTIKNWTTCLDGIHKRVKEMDEMRKSVSPKDRMNYDREHMFLKQVVLEQHNFLSEWFQMLHQTIGRYDHYHGNVRLLAFRIDSDRFKFSFWHNWTLKWTGRILVFENLLSDLIAEMKGQMS